MNALNSVTPDRKHLLVPISHTVGDPQLRATEQYARSLDADVLLVHVLPRRDAHREAAAQAYLDTLVDNLASHGIHAQAVVRSGGLTQTIIAEAQRTGPAAIVLGASRRNALLSAVMGNVSAAIARGVQCPVIPVQRPRSTESRSELWDFDAAAERTGPLRQRLPRPQTVDLARIVGSVDRARELGSDFRPRRSARRTGDDERLEGIRKALAQGKPLPAVDLYQLGSGFYVLDGHHRVAAALLLGQVAIDANVVEHVPVGRLATAA